MIRRVAIVPFLLVSLLTSVVTTSLVTTTASAQTDADRARARGHFEQGVSLYESGQHRAALEQFQEAYRIAPHPMVRVNMANCYEQLGRPLEAIHHFERFLAEAEAANPQQRREVETAMRRLEGQLGEVRLSVTPDGASVTIDGAETRRAPILDPIRLSAGTHQVVVRLDGYRTQTRDLRVAGGSEERVSIRLERTGSAPVATATTTTTATPAASDTESTETTDSGDDPDETSDVETASSDQDTGSSDTLADPSGDESQATDDGEDMPPMQEDEGGGWQLRITTPVIIAGAATGGLLLGAIITGSIAVAANSDFESAADRYDMTNAPADRQDAQSAADLANAMSIVSDVFLIGTIAAAGATAFFVIIEGMESDNDDATATRVRAAPMASQDSAGLMLSGQF
ncbi:MAG: PEGA domain-containing protein [Sandaracinaceae bacterium]